MLRRVEKIKSNSVKKISSTISQASNYWDDMTDRFDNELEFFKLWLEKPRILGAALPTSMVTAQRMASIVRTGEDRHVLELGPGSGIITKSILNRGLNPENLHLVEYTQEFVDILRRNYPDVNVLHGDAFKIGNVLKNHYSGRFDTIISAIPLLNFSVKERLKLLDMLFHILEPGRPVVQISYGPKSPIPPNFDSYTVESLDWMVRNIPPARLWIYRRITT